MKTIFNKAMIAMLAPLSLVACGEPAHTHKTADGIKPDAGYNWQNPNDKTSSDVVWEPGKINPDYPHIHAGLAEGQWDADEGYVLSVEGSNNAIWVPGSRNSQYPHITAAVKPDTWSADAGYSFVDVQKGLSVQIDVRNTKPQLRPSQRGGQRRPELH